MKQIVLSIASVYGLTSVILGALGSHAFKKILSPEKLSSFEIGTKYQMYHALVLLIIGFYLPFQSTLEKTSAWCFILGSFFFSVSIYFLSFAEYWNINLKFLGPVTPLGGLLMIIGWSCILVYFLKGFK